MADQKTTAAAAAAATTTHAAPHATADGATLIRSAERADSPADGDSFLSVRAFLDPTAAVEFYRARCATRQVSVNRHFVKVLGLGRTDFDLHGGYLGERGIVPVVETLAQVAVTEIDLRDCLVGTEDVRVMSEHFANHGRLEKIDLRGNTISDAAAKLLLQLVNRNRHLHQVLLDATVPRRQRIEKQCLTNSRGGGVDTVQDGNTTTASRAAGTCVVCGTLFVQDNSSPTTAAYVNLTLSTVLGHFARTGDATSAVGNEVLFRLLATCCDAGDGVLFLCTEACAEQLGQELLQCVPYVLATCHSRAPCTPPKLVLLRDGAEQLAKELGSRKGAVAAPDVYREMPASVNADGDFSILRFLDEASPGYREPKFCCSVCGGRTDGLPSVPSQLIRQFRDDFMTRPLTAEGTVGVNGTNSLFPILRRICSTFVHYSYEPVCSRACAQDIVRFGVFGYRGVIRAYPNYVPPLSTALGPFGTRTMRLLPQLSFSVVDFAAVTVDDVGTEQTVCAITVASAMEDIDGVPMDPYFLHAMGRHLAKQPVKSVGCELQSVCEAARVCGSLAQSEAPLQRRRGDRPPSSVHGASAHGEAGEDTGRGFTVGDWENWGAVFGKEKVITMLHTAFARRRQGLYMVDGPHDNLFDNVRAALWAFRHQRRSVLVALEFSASWLTCDNGLVSDAAKGAQADEQQQQQTRRGSCDTFFTTVKIVGQSVVANTSHLILQGNFGPTAGNRGFFYVDKGTFLRRVCGNAYVFVDFAALQQNTSDALALSNLLPSSYAAQVCTSAALGVVAHLGHARVILKEMASADSVNSAYPRNLRRGLREAMACVADASSPSTTTKAAEQWLRYVQHLLDVKGVAATGQLLFFLSEICPGDVVARLNRAVAIVREACPSIPYALIEASEHRPSRAVSEPKADKDLKKDSPLISPGGGDPVSSPRAARGSQPSTATTGSPVACRDSSAAAAQTPKEVEEEDTQQESLSRVKKGAARSSRSEERRKQMTAGKRARGSGSDAASTVSSSPSPPRPSSASGKRKGSRRGSPPRRQTTTQGSPRESTVPVRKARARSASTQTRGVSPTVPNKVGASGEAQPPSSPLPSGNPVGSPVSASQGNPRMPQSTSRPATWESFSPHLLGQPWSLINLVDATGAPTAHMAAFTQDQVCVYTTSNSSADKVSPAPPHVAMPLTSMETSALFADLPFSSGFDCAFHHPLHHRQVYFISGGMGVVWDAYLQQCVSGPFLLSTSSTFARLPAAFLSDDDTSTNNKSSSSSSSSGAAALECVVPLYGTPFVVLFRQLVYAVYDMEKGIPVSDTLVLRLSSRAAGRGKNGEGLVTMAEEARAVAMRKKQAQCTGGVGSGNACTMDGEEGQRPLWTQALPLFGDDLVSQLPRSPVTSAWLPHPRPATGAPTPRDASELVLITADGYCHTLSLPTDLGAGGSSAVITSAKQVPLSETPLAQLPAAFQQCRLSHLPILCSTALQATSQWETVDALEPFAPSSPLLSEGTVAVTSTLPVTSSESRETAQLLSLGCVERDGTPAGTCPAQIAEEDLFSRNTLYCGEYTERTCPRSDGEEQECAGVPTWSASSPVMAHTITMDLGPGNEESFAAVVLVLNTAAMHPSVLHHAPLKVGVEVSDDGVVFRPHAEFLAGLRGDASVTAGAWRTNPAHVSRFWQLCFHTHLPSEVGVVRTIWFREETPSGGVGPTAGFFEPLRPYVALRGDDVGEPLVHIEAPRVYREPATLLLPMPTAPVFATTTSSTVAARRSAGDTAPRNAAASAAAAPRGWYAPHAIISLPTAAAPQTAATATDREEEKVSPPSAQLGGPTTCLFFCGADFVEFDLSLKDVVAQRSHKMGDHPALRALPFPFAHGLQSAFHLDPVREPTRVMLLADGLFLHWDLGKGAAVDEEAPAQRFAEVDAMKGMPLDVPTTHELVTIVNDWARPNELYIFFSTRSDVGAGGRCISAVEVLRWNHVAHELVERPVRVCEHPLFREAFAGLSPDAQLHCLFVGEDRTITVFADKHVVSIPTSTVGKVSVRELSASPDFHQLFTHLPEFASLRTQSTLTIDLRDAGALVLGVELVSTHEGVTDGVGETWLIAFSDDGHRWTRIGHHTHRGPTSRATWRPGQVAGVSHRFWQLSCSCAVSSRTDSLSGQDITAEDGCGMAEPNAQDAAVPHYLYTQVTLLTIPESSCDILPECITLSGGSTVAPHPAELLKCDGKRNELCKLAEACNSNSTPASLCFAAGSAVAAMTLDYGRATVELTSFRCRRRCCPLDKTAMASGASSQETEVWAVESSEDGERWSACGAWCTRGGPTESVQLCWAPTGPARFWRITARPRDAEQWEDATMWCDLSLHSYRGHTASVRSGRPLSAKWKGPSSNDDDNNEAVAMTATREHGTVRGTATYVTALSLLTQSIRPVPSASAASSSPSRAATLLPLAIGSTLTVDTKADTPAAVTGMLISCDPRHLVNKQWAGCVSRVELLVEFSANNKHWYAATSALYFSGQEQPVFVRWASLGTYRYWRLRVLRVEGSDAGVLAIDQLQLYRAEPQLYRSFLSQKSVRESVSVDGADDDGTAHGSAAQASAETAAASFSDPESLPPHSTEMVYLRLPTQQAIVRVSACLPPWAVYVVERLELDGISWTTVARLSNAGGSTTREITKAWTRGQSSSTWRLRGVTPAASEGVGVALPVQWDAFVDERAVPVDLSKVPNVRFAHVGFAELMPAELLFRGKTLLLPDVNKTVLRAAASASAAAAASPSNRLQRTGDPCLVWSFVSPVAFHQIALNVRLCTGSADGECGHSGEANGADAPSCSSPLGTGSIERLKLKGGERAGAGKSKRPPSSPATATTTTTTAATTLAKPTQRGGKLSGGRAGSPLRTPTTDVPTTGAGGGVLATATTVVLVETSYNGIDYVAVAACAVPGTGSSVVTLSWENGDRSFSAPHWRVRCENLSANDTLDLVSATWYTVAGVPGLAPAGDALAMNNTAYAAWQQDVFNREDTFCRDCQAGFDQARSQAAKLREGGDVDRRGQAADAVWRMKKRFAAFVAKVSKDAAHKSGDAEENQLLRRVPERWLPFLATGRELATDLLFFVYKIGERYPESDVSRLIAMAGDRVNAAKGLLFTKRESGTWFYPHFALYTSGIKDDFHGIDGTAVTASFGVYWSQSLALQRDTDVLLASVATAHGGPEAKTRKSSSSTRTPAEAAPGLSELSPHVASPLLSLFWEHKKTTPWVAAECFPGLPALQFAGFGNPPPSTASGGSAAAAAQQGRSSGTCMVCALNEMTFSHRYPLTLGESGSQKALPPPAFPYRVCPGVNFIHFATVPPFLVAALRALYRQSFLESYRTTVVFTGTSLDTRSGQLRFTLPASEGGLEPDGRVSLGLSGVSIESLEFEVNIRATPVSGLGNGELRRTGSKDYGSDNTAPAAAPTDDTSLPERVALRRRRYAFTFHVNIISHGAFCSLPTTTTTTTEIARPRGTPPFSEGSSPTDPTSPAPPARRSIAVSIICGLDPDSPVVPIRCRCRNANIPLLSSPSMVLSSFDLTAAAERRADGRGLRCPQHHIAAKVRFVDDDHEHRCWYSVPSGVDWNAVDELHMTLASVSLANFVANTRALLNTTVADSPTTSRKKQRNCTAEQEWLAELPVTLSHCTVSVNVREKLARGVGARVQLYDATSCDAAVFVNSNGFIVRGTVGDVHIGNLHLEPDDSATAGRVPYVIGNASELCLPSSSSTITTTRGSGHPPATGPAPVLVRLEGRSRLLSRHRTTPVSVEVSQQHLLCIASTPFADVSLATTNIAAGSEKRAVVYRAVRPVCDAAQVVVNKEVFFQSMAALLGRAPMVCALRVHGLPFTFMPQEMSVLEPMRVTQHRLSVVLRGVFFGNWFEVIASTTELADVSSVAGLSHTLALKVLEQNQDALWKSYVNIVGLRPRSNLPNDDAASASTHKSFLTFSQRETLQQQ